MRGITSCRVFVLVFSENANSSGHVRRQVAKAFSLGLHVIPFRIEETLPQSSLSYFLETVHWLDAVTPPLENHLTSLTERVKKLLANGDSGTNSPIAPEGIAYPGLSAPPKRTRWLVGAGLAIASGVVAAAAWLYISGNPTAQQPSSSLLAEASAKSVAVLPFESISSTKDDDYFADGVQDEILNDLAKIAQLKVISRTSVMQYRADTKRDVRQIAYALGVANVLEGTVRREGNRVRVSTQLVDARNDSAVWADSYDRDLTDIFAIQSEVAQTIAGKLSAALSPEEKQRIEAKPTENMRAYDLYLQAKEKLENADLVTSDREKPIRNALDLLQQAVELDPDFAVAYCSMAVAHDALYLRFDPTPERRAMGDDAINNALRSQPNLPEVHLAYANHLYRCYADYDRADAQLEIARRGIPNNAAALHLEASMNRRSDRFDKAIQKFNEAITLDPRNPLPISDLAETLSYTRQFSTAEGTWDRLIALVPDRPLVRLRKEYFTTVLRTGDDTALRVEIESLAASMPDDKLLRSVLLNLVLDHRDWPQAKQLLEKMKGEEDSKFAYGESPVPIGCYSILLARLQGEQVEGRPEFAETRQLLSRKVAAAPANAALLSSAAVVDALLGHKENAISEAKRAVEMLPISKDAIDGPNISINLALVYAWTDEADLAFQHLNALVKVPYGLFYNYVKLAPYFDPLRKDPRFDKLLAELAPHEKSLRKAQKTDEDDGLFQPLKTTLPNPERLVFERVDCLQLFGALVAACKEYPLAHHAPIRLPNLPAGMFR
jgi:TolB-like protein/predicted Zn-dependent protease